VLLLNFDKRCLKMNCFYNMQIEIIYTAFFNNNIWTYTHHLKVISIICNFVYAHRPIMTVIMLPEKISEEHIVAALSIHQSVPPSVRPSVVRTSNSCPAHNFVIWSRISKLFYNFLHKWSSYWDNMSRATFGSLFEGQGHSMTFQHNHVRPITSLFEVLFKNYFT